MKVRKLFMLMTLSLVLCSGVNSTKANSLEDPIGVTEEVQTTETQGSNNSSNPIGDYVSNYNPISSENMAEAGAKLSPLQQKMGVIMGYGVVLIYAFFMFFTVCDLLYIVAPPIRGLMYKRDAQQGGGMGGMGGMGGYGSRGGYGGYGGQQGGQTATSSIRFISDEAIASVQEASGADQQEVQGGYGGATGMQQTPSRKSSLGTYFKSRLFAMVMLAICTVVLLSSVLLGTGINLGQWFLNVVEGFNNSSIG